MDAWPSSLNRKRRLDGGSSSSLSSAARHETPGQRVLRTTLQYKGTANFRARLVLATLASRPVRIRAIREDDEAPGLASFEASFVRLLDKLTNGSHVEINETGTTLYYRPGIIVGGSVEHDCSGNSEDARSVGWFIEGILPLAPFSKKPFALHFVNCRTNDDRDMSTDFLKEVTLPMLRGFGLGSDPETSSLLELTVSRRGAPPLGGGIVDFRCPVVRRLKPIDWTDPGLVSKVRGVAYSTKVSPQVANRAVFEARGVLNDLLPDVFIFTDVYSGKTSGNSPGFALLLTAETTTGAALATEAAGSAGTLPEELAKRVVSGLLEEVWEGGTIDATHQPLVLTLMALGPEDVTRVRAGKLTKPAMEQLRLIREFLGVTFKVKPDTEKGDKSVLLSCLGSGHVNVAKQVT